MARKRTEITIHQKAKICAIKESKKMSLSELSQIIRREIDMDLGISTLSEILKNKEKWENRKAQTLTPDNLRKFILCLRIH